MAKFTCPIKYLVFYVGQDVHRFENGEFTTEDPEVIKVLEQISDVVRIEEVDKSENKTGGSRTKKAPAK